MIIWLKPVHGVKKLVTRWRDMDDLVPVAGDLTEWQFLFSCADAV